jgi:hypothetical protein
VTSVSPIAHARLQGAMAAGQGQALAACPLGFGRLVAAWAEGWLVFHVSGKASGANGLAMFHGKPSREGAAWLPVEVAALRLARRMDKPVPHAALARLMGRSPRAVAVEASRQGITARRKRAA